MRESRVEPHMREALSRHLLEEVVRTTEMPRGRARIFYMAEPGTRAMSVDLIFAAGRIFLSGDLRITDGNGVISDFGYGLEWFAGRNEEDYLAEKFLRRRHCPELAVEGMKDMAEHYFANRFLDGEEPDEEAKKIKAALEEAASEGDGGACRSSETLYELFVNLGLDPSDGVPGFGYDPTEVGWLAAVQQRFAELYAKREGA